MNRGGAAGVCRGTQGTAGGGDSSATVTVGPIQLPAERGDYWVTARGAAAPAGPVTVLVGGNREPVESIVGTVALLLAVSGPDPGGTGGLENLPAGATGIEPGGTHPRLRRRGHLHRSARRPCPGSPTGDEITAAADGEGQTSARSSWRVPGLGAFDVTCQ